MAVPHYLRNTYYSNEYLTMITVSFSAVPVSHVTVLALLNDIDHNQSCRITCLHIFTMQHSTLSPMLVHLELNVVDQVLSQFTAVMSQVGVDTILTFLWPVVQPLVTLMCQCL